MLFEKHGPLHQIITAQETLLEPVARATEALGLRGMSVATVCRALDKPCLKRILEQAGIKTARDQLITSNTDARRFVDEVGFPIVLKPLGGSGGLATWCIRSAEQLELALELMQPSPEGAVLAEDYLRGQELCIDTITIANEPQFYSICCYRPSILKALENPRVQWSCVMPRDISGDPFREFIEQGLKAVRALSVGNAITHMEGFLLAEGGLGFTDATLRPAGARICPMLEFAYDVDPHLAWARVAVDGCFDGPWERRYAVGTFFLRGMGSGRVEHIAGIEAVRQHIGALLVDARLPRVGATKSATYTGDGYITVRHPETEVVEDALQLSRKPSGSPTASRKHPRLLTRLLESNGRNRFSTSTNNSTDRPGRRTLCRVSAMRDARTRRCNLHSQTSKDEEEEPVTLEAPRAFNREMYHDHPENVFYGTDDGSQDGSFGEFPKFKAHYEGVAPLRRENIHMISVVGGLYGLNLIPLWRPRRITIFDINPTAITYFRIIHRVFTTSRNVEHFLGRLTAGDYDAETEDEQFVQENIRLKQKGCLPRSRGSTKRPYEQSWQYAFESFDLTKQLLSEVPLDIRTEPMESETFSGWIRDQNNLWIYASNITQFHYFDLEFADPANVVLLQIIHPEQPQLLDLAPLSGGPVKVKFEIPLRAERIDK